MSAPLPSSAEAVNSTFDDASEAWIAILASSLSSSTMRSSATSDAAVRL